MKIEVHFLGQPAVFVDGSRLCISQKKVEAMLLYILFNGSCTRDELAAVFWCDCDEESARRNLRNGLYKIRNLLGKDFLLTGGKSYVNLNPIYEIERDVDLFVAQNSGQKILELKNLCFLDRYYLKNCLEFEEWIRSIRSTYERILTEKLLPAMRLSFNKGALALAGRYAECIRRFDPYNEETVYISMKIYGQNGDYNKAALIYTQFVEFLKAEMGLNPGQRIKNEYDHILQIKAEMRRTENNGTFYLGHLRALAALQEEYSRYEREETYATCVLCGDAGMGKDTVWQEFVKESGQGEPLHVWFQPFNSSVNYYAIVQILLRLAKWAKLSEEEVIPSVLGESSDLFFMSCIDRLSRRIQSLKKRGVLIVHNLEFADDKSVYLILTYLLEQMKKRIFIVAGLCRNITTKALSGERLKTIRGIREINLETLKEGECTRYIKECLPAGKSVTREEKELFQYTAGNLALLWNVAENISLSSEYIYELNSKSSQKLEMLLQSLEGQEYSYFEYMAILENGVETDALSSMTGQPLLEVMKTLELLKDRGILEEVRQKGCNRLKICSKMIRDYVYVKISDFRKKELHKMALGYYEALLLKEKKNLFIINELLYHSKCSGRVGDTLYYDVAYMRYVLDYYDEFFPAVPQDIEILQEYTITRKEIYISLEEYEARLEALENEIAPGRFAELQMELFYLRGRTLNRDGKRDEGLVYAQRLISLAKKEDNIKMLLNGYIEALCYGVKAEDPQLMEKYLIEVKRIENLSAHQIEYGSILRLESYCHILNEEYARAEKLLKESIGIFDSPKFRNIYFYSAAGAYDYLAITYRCRGNYEDAQKAMEHALRLCHEKNIRKGLDLFYEDYAYILFLQGEAGEAEKYFRLSIQIYDDYGTYWLRSIGESCLAVIELERGNEKESLEHFRRAEIFSRKENTQEEKTVLDMARQKLRDAKLLM